MPSLSNSLLYPDEVPLSNAVRRGILSYICKPLNKKFSKYCNDFESLFGAPASRLRIRVQRYRSDTLRRRRKDPVKFSQLLVRHGLISAEDLPSNPLESMEAESMNEADSVDTTSSFFSPSPYRKPSNMPKQRPSYKHSGSYDHDDEDYSSYDYDEDTYSQTQGGDNRANPNPNPNFEAKETFVRTLHGEVDFDVMESNTNGILTILGHQKAIDHGKKNVNFVTFIVPVPYFPDVMKVKVELTAEFDGIIIYSPSMATPFYNQHKAVLRAMAPGCQETEKAYTTEATRVLCSPMSQRQKTVMKFPKNITCNKDHFNEEAEGKYNLSVQVVSMMGTDPRFKNDNGELEEFPLAFAVVRVAVNGTEKLAQVSEKNDGTADIAKLMKGINGINVSARSNTMDYEGKAAKFQAEMNRQREEATRNIAREEQQAAALIALKMEEYKKSLDERQRQADNAFFQRQEEQNAILRQQWKESKTEMFRQEDVAAAARREQEDEAAARREQEDEQAEFHRKSNRSNKEHADQQFEIRRSARGGATVTNANEQRTHASRSTKKMLALNSYPTHIQSDEE